MFQCAIIKISMKKVFKNGENKEKGTVFQLKKKLPFYTVSFASSYRKNTLNTWQHWLTRSLDYDNMHNNCQWQK